MTTHHLSHLISLSAPLRGALARCKAPSDINSHLLPNLVVQPIPDIRIAIHFRLLLVQLLPLLPSPPYHTPPISIHTTTVDRLSQASATDSYKELQTHRDHVYAHETHLQAHQTQLQLQSTLIQTQHQVHETRFQMQQAELAALRETDRRRQDQMVETLRVIRDMRREMSDMQAELLALREQQRRARQPGPEARIPDHQDASGDADSHI
ncbi:hypothetical protein Tco_0295610 [Tanacetum coccineum]